MFEFSAELFGPCDLSIYASSRFGFFRTTTFFGLFHKKQSPEKKRPVMDDCTLCRLQTCHIGVARSRFLTPVLKGRTTFEIDESSNCAKKNLRSNTQPSPRSVCVFFPCSTCVCLQLHVDILLRDIQGCRGKLRPKAYRGSWRVVPELKLFAGCFTAFFLSPQCTPAAGVLGWTNSALSALRKTKQTTHHQVLNSVQLALRGK